MSAKRVILGLGALLVTSALVLATVRSGLAADLDKEICDTALGMEDYPRAITLHLELLDRRPDDALAHYHLGFAYGMTGRLAEEIGEYHHAIELGARNWDLFLNLGLAYREERDTANETAAFENAVMLGGIHPEAHLNLSLAYEDENQLHEALHQIAITRRLAPQDRDAANVNAILCSKSGDQACARRIWTKLVSSAPSYAPARTNLAILEHSKN